MDMWIDKNDQTVIRLRVSWGLFKRLLPALIFDRNDSLKRCDYDFWYFMGHEVAGKDKYLLAHQDGVVDVFREWQEHPPSEEDIETLKRGMADRASEGV